MIKQFKYEFVLDVQKVYLRIPSQCSVQIWWRRGKGKTTTKNSVKLKGGQSYFKVSEPLAIQGKCSYKNGQFESKQSLIQIVIFNYDNTTKLGGACTVDLVKIISPTNISMNHSQNFQLPLENTPDKNAKILFNLSVKFLGQCHQDSIADVSFQQLNMNQTSDLTFRPSSRERNKSQQRKTSEGFFKQPESPLQLNTGAKEQKSSQENLPPKPSERPMQFSFNPSGKPDAMERERQNKAQMELISELRQQINEKTRQVQQLKQRILKGEQTERRSTLSTNEKSLQLMNELNVANSKVEEMRRELKDKDKHIAIVEKENDEIRGEKIGLKKQLERVNGQLALQKQKSAELQTAKSENRQMAKKIEFLTNEQQQLKQELFKRQSHFITLENKCEKYEKQLMANRQKSSNELVEINEELKQLKTKIDQLYEENLVLKKDNSDLKKVVNERTKQLQKFNSEQYKMEQELQTWKKNAKVIVQEKESQKDNLAQKCQQLQLKYQQLQLKSQSSQLKIQSLQQQKQMLQQKLMSCQQSRQQLQIGIRQAQQAKSQLQSSLKQQQQKYTLLEQHFRQKQQLLQEIQFEFHQLQSTNNKEKDFEMTMIRQKLSLTMKKVEQLQKNEESLNILASEQKVRIKNLESACDNLQKQLDQKEQVIEQKQSIIEKAKVYVKEKEKQIEERDQFIASAKKFMEQRQQEFNEERQKLQDYLANATSNTNLLTKDKDKQLQSLKRKLSQLSYQLQTIQITLNDKEDNVKQLQAQVIQSKKIIHGLQQQMGNKQMEIEDLKYYINSQHQKIEIFQEELQQVNRKNKGLNQTLEEVVRKNFDIEIQLNIKKAELDSIRTYR